MKSIDLYRLELTSGIYSRVATKLRLGPTGRAHVSRVAKGERTSKRVSAALEIELQRIDRLVQKRRAQQHRDLGLERAA